MTVECIASIMRGRSHYSEEYRGRTENLKLLLNENRNSVAEKDPVPDLVPSSSNHTIPPVFFISTL